MAKCRGKKHRKKRWPKRGGKCVDIKAVAKSGGTSGVKSGTKRVVAKSRDKKWRQKVNIYVVTNRPVAESREKKHRLKR